MNELLSEAVLPNNEYPEAEAGINVSYYQLGQSGKADSELLFGNITVGQLKKALKSATHFIDYTKFELGNDWGK